MNSIKVTRTYENFGGVDFLSEPSLVLPQRSPDALNVWKNYQSMLGICIETRPGLKHLASFEGEINGIYVFSASKAVVHSGTKLYAWTNFPDIPTQQYITLIYQEMNNHRTSFNKFGDYLYINDGSNYLYYDGTEVRKVSEIAYIPTTTIGRNPKGGGEKLEDVNLLQSKRKNSFCADGSSKDYYLDTIGIGSVEKITVNDNLQIEGTDYTVDKPQGKITFTTAPSRPLIEGQDNVIITFIKEIEGYAERIENCNKALIWDNRVFYTGNPNYPNAFFHSELNNPAYISDLSYYEEGTDSPIKDIVVGSNVLWVFKNNDQNNSNVFYHEASIDSEQGAVYPREQGNVEVGCVSQAINFLDDILYLSNEGLEGIATENINSRQVIAHRSSLIDPKMTNDSYYRNACMCVYNGYLMILVNGKIFLADSRQKFSNFNSFEYEWYYWDISSISPVLLKEYDGSLYIGTSDGKVFILDGTNDNQEAINSYWTTPLDDFGYNNMIKTTNKRGGIIKVKNIPNGRIKILRKTNKKSEFESITELSANSFDFNRIDFSNFNFCSDTKSYIVLKLKEKKFSNLSLKFCSDVKDKPFGIISATEEVFVGGYIKR